MLDFQTKRAEIRRNGYVMINKLLCAVQTMSDSIKYAGLVGLLGGLMYESPPYSPLKPHYPLTPSIQGIESVIPYTKYMVLLEKSKLLDYILIELKAKVLNGEMAVPLPLKMSANYGAHALLNKPARGRQVVFEHPIFITCTESIERG